jgi:hypothetical protein
MVVAEAAPGLWRMSRDTDGRLRIIITTSTLPGTAFLAVL